MCFDVPPRQFVFVMPRPLRSSRSWHTKKNYQIFTARDFIASTVQHIPLKGQQTIRYYGLYSNK